MVRRVRLSTTAAESVRLAQRLLFPRIEEGAILGYLRSEDTVASILAERRYPSNILPEYTVDGWLRNYISESQRIVCYIDRSFVVKFGCPINAYTGGQNTLESLRWAEYRTEPFRGFFTAILGAASDGSWIITERADLSPAKETPEFVRLHDVLATGLGLKDIRPGNTGYHTRTGKLVCRDYGFSPSEPSLLQLARTCGLCMWCQLRQRLSPSQFPPTLQRAVIR